MRTKTGMAKDGRVSSCQIDRGDARGPYEKSVGPKKAVVRGTHHE